MSFLYYSTQSSLAYLIASEFYDDTFYVYCAEVFDPPTNPGSSSPKNVYETLRLIVQRGDRRHPKVIDTRKALKRVARRKMNNGDITDEQYKAIKWAIDKAEARDFAPLIFLILRDTVAHRTHRVPMQQRASLSSEEYIIPDLKPDEFEILQGL